MLLIWGIRETNRKLGWAAEFCPICRAVGPVYITQKGRVPHLYWIPLGRRKITGHEVACHTCGLQATVQEVPYQAYVKNRSMDLVDLTLQTNPDIMDIRAERLALEDRLAAGALNRSERAELILEPFEVVRPMILPGARAGHIPTGAGLAIIALVFLTPAAVMLWVSPKMPFEARIVVTGIAVLIAALGAYSWKVGGARWVRRKLHPLLVRALSPLRPTRDELAAAMETLRLQKAPIAGRVNLDWLMEDLAAEERRLS